MKATPQKFLITALTLVVISFTPLYFYFSRDVTLLLDHYPHQLIQNQDISYSLVKEKPRHWLKLKQISPFLKGAIILSEDWSFYQHEGVDLKQLAQALGEIGGTRKLRGASTITQQMVKNIYLSSERSWWRKLHETILAIKVENTLSKERILEIYLNSIEYGPGIFGIQNASSYYFQKSAIKLTPRESAFIAMLLPNPRLYSVSFEQKKLTEFARLRVEEILIKMRVGKAITPEQYLQQLNSRFPWESLQ